jgi:hypothetical protein
VKPGHTALAAAAMGATLLLAGPASATAEEQGEAARKKALEEDFLNTRFDEAARRLRAAIEACGTDACSRKLRVRLNLALGSVLASGKKELSDAGDAFVEALTLDPKAQVDPDIASSEITFAFEQAKKRLGIGAAGAKKGKTAKGASEKESASEKEGGKEGEKDKAEPEKPTEAPPSGEARRNWFTLAFSPDIAVVSGVDVCSKAAQSNEHFYCARPNGTRYVGTPTRGNGDQINSGVVLSTMRVTLGYDRLLGEHITLGARLGFAFNGASGAGASFLPVHAEARLGFWPSASPFVGAGVRPFLFLAGGVAQVDSHVEVEILEDGGACEAIPPSDPRSDCTKPSHDGVLEPRKQTVSAYKQAGLAFAAAGAGVQFAPTPGVAFHLAVRAGITFPSVVPVITPEAGFALGF